MKKSYKIIWGILTPAPIVMILVGIICLFIFIIKAIPEKGAVPSPDMPGEMVGGILFFYILFFAGIFLSFFIYISYMIHLVRKDDMSKDMKTLWVVLFSTVTLLAMIVYWFMVVLPEPEPGAENSGLAPVKRVRKK